MSRRSRGQRRQTNGPHRAHKRSSCEKLSLLLTGLRRIKARNCTPQLQMHRRLSQQMQQRFTDRKSVV